MKKLFQFNSSIIAIILIVGLFACKSEKKKLSEEIYNLEVSDSSSTPKGMSHLADLYYNYFKQFPKDSISEKYLFKAFMFKYMRSEWETALNFGRLYQNNYPKTEYAQNINVKLGDIFFTGLHNSDSSVAYYLKAEQKAQFFNR